MRQIPILVGAVLFLSVSTAAQGPGLAGAGTRSGPRFPSNYGHTDWQVAICYQYNRINMAGVPYNANGLNTSLVRFFGNWFALEGQLGLGFGTTAAATVPPSLTAKSVFVGGGARLAHRGHGRIKPWVHGVVGMEYFRFSQTAGLLGSNKGLGGVGGGGVDVRLGPRTSFRAEADWLGTRFFSANQGHFQVVTGLVFNF
jgi:hypothetical protein